MNIGSTGSSTASLPVQASAKAPESAEVKKSGPDGDGDADDGGAKKVAAPTVNTNGQTVGQIINTKA